MLAHVRNGELERIISDAQTKSWLTLENGDKVSPIVSGYVNGNDKILPVVQEIQDTSTGIDVVETRSSWEVRPNEVYRLVTIRDKTQAEIDAEAEQKRTDVLNRVYKESALKILATALWHTNKGTVPQQALANPDNFKQWLRSLG